MNRNINIKYDIILTQLKLVHSDKKHTFSSELIEKNCFILFKILEQNHY